MKKIKQLKRNVRRGSKSTQTVPSTEVRIRQRAYEIHQARGGASGRDLDDWLQAEREIKAEMDQLSEEDPTGPEELLPPQG
jgi:hypothetical protein